MSFRHVAVAARRFLVRRPWVYWSIVALAVGATAAVMLDHHDRVDDARRAWGEQRTVWVASVDHSPGDPLAVEPRDFPATVVGSGAISRPDDAIARQHIAAGEVVHRLDIAAAHGPQAVTPAGWLIVPLTESPPSGARLGDRVVVTADGVVVAADALVVGHHGDATLVAVPADAAPIIPAASDAGRATLLLVP